MCAFAKPADFEFPQINDITERKTAELLSAWNSDLFTLIVICVFSSQRRNSLRARSAYSCNQALLHSGDSQ